MYSIYVLTFLIVVGYLFLSKLRSDKRKILATAEIEKISLSIMDPDIILPELEIEYKYYFAEGIYIGQAYVLLKDFLQEYEYETGFTKTAEPFLSIGEKVFVTEEHIEAFLINQFSTVLIQVDPKEPYISNFDSLHYDPISISFF